MASYRGRKYQRAGPQHWPKSARVKQPSLLPVNPLALKNAGMRITPARVSGLTLFAEARAY